MKTIGIIGGIAPESTIEYYRLILSLYHEQKQDDNNPPILINSINLKKLLDLVGTGQLDHLAQYLSDEIDKLAHAGADVGLLASNTPHVVFDRLAVKSPIPLVSIVEAACQAAQSLGLKKVGLFGTRFTMQGQFYPSVFAKQGIDIIAPDAVEQTFIHDKYMGELVKGIFLPETRQQLLKIVEHMQQQQGIQGLILGGTELPLILREATYNGIPFLDTTRIHVQQAVARMLE
jgi:aspartate racemase